MRLVHGSILRPIFRQGFATAAASSTGRRWKCISSSSETGRSQRLEATRRWLDSVVIAETLCPFAAAVREAPKLRLRASEAVDEAALLNQGLHQQPVDGSTMIQLPETTLVVLDASMPFCAAWQDLVRLSWRLQYEAILAQGLERDLQLVLFHPLAMHSAYSEGLPDPADYSLRSPHPMIHLLREADVLRAVQSYPEAEQIPSRNKSRLRKQGLELCAARLQACSSTR
ncbi:unnamed protein product [Polarella glacialis]|uniref:DUF1415 domain-containing protein n=1 Tax=Polarella glacialis TaxID=89957 RepID=A0A813HQF7_POLGL|nr:unnamed protein product [Polarella glacialis]